MFRHRYDAGMGRRLFDLLAAGSMLGAMFAIAVWARGHYYSDSGVILVGGTFVQVNSVPGKLRVEWAPGWPYPEQLKRGWTSWRYGPEAQAPVLGAGSTNALGFGYDRYTTLVLSGQVLEDGSMPSTAVSGHVLILPVSALVLAGGALPAMGIVRRWRKRRPSEPE